jgi:hypothetical protein
MRAWLLLKRTASGDERHWLPLLHRQRQQQRRKRHLRLLRQRGRHDRRSMRRQVLAQGGAESARFLPTPSWRAPSVATPSTCF